MNRKTRTAVAAFAALAAALPAASARGAYTPSLTLSSSTSAYRGSGTTVLRIVQPDADEATAKADLRAPAGYEIALSQPLGAVLGSVELQGKREPDGTDVRLSGEIRTADVAQLAAAAVACTGLARHDAAWLLVAGGLRVPVFADAAPAARLRFCLPPPATLGLRVLRTTLTLNDVFTNPAVRGEYRWSAVFLPYGGAGAVESQAIVRLPPRLTLTRKVIVVRRRGRVRRVFVRLRGVVSTGGRGVRGARVEVLAGPSADFLARIAFTTSYGGGRFSLVTELPERTVFQARVTVGPREAPLGQCVPGDPAIRCVSVSTASFSARSRRLTVRRPRPVVFSRRPAR